MFSKDNSCLQCTFIADDNEGGLAVYTCSKDNDKSEMKGFPFEKAPQECFLLDFWHSEFAEEFDGSEESLNIAMEKWKCKYYHN